MGVQGASPLAGSRGRAPGRRRQKNLFSSEDQSMVRLIGRVLAVTAALALAGWWLRAPHSPPSAGSSAWTWHWRPGEAVVYSLSYDVKGRTNVAALASGAAAAPLVWQRLDTTVS